MRSRLCFVYLTLLFELGSVIGLIGCNLPGSLGSGQSLAKLIADANLATRELGPAGVTESLSGQINFSFTLTSAARTSAGVYAKDGTLLRTLWSGLALSPGVYPRTWDGVNDDGQRVPDGDYDIRILQNNVSYTYEGVLGNSSMQADATKMHRGFALMKGMVAVGSNLYIAADYNEGISQFRASVSNPQIRTPMLQDRASGDSGSVSQATGFVVSDGNYIYWGGYDYFDSNESFVYASRVDTEREVAFANGVLVQVASGRNYTNAISRVNDANGRITGLAVQKTGPHLFVSRKALNQVQVLDKLTGALKQTLTIPAAQSLTTDNDNNLWVVSGTQTLSRYSVNADGSLNSASVSVTGLVKPLAIAVSPDNGTLLVADGGTSQQLKAFSNANGTSLWTYGQAGGYANGPVVSDSKFYFEDSVSVKGAFLAYQADGSFWVADPGNYRIQHLRSSDRSRLDQISYFQRLYSIAVDKNNLSRVFGEYLEFAVDYSKPLLPNNGSWTLVKNWRYGVPASHLNTDFMGGIFSNIFTLSNGRTYATHPAPGNTNTIFELPNDGSAIRLTGISLSPEEKLQADGSLRRFYPASIGSAVRWESRSLTGFTNGNPVWGNPITIANIASVQANDPCEWWGGAPDSGDQTSSGIVISFDHQLQTGGHGQGYHLGGIRNGGTQWLWKTARATRPDYIGEFPENGDYDVGNHAQYAGTEAMAIGRNIFWQYHGEFWKDSQTNKFNHVYDDGLFLGQFGSTGKDPIPPSGTTMAGNALRSQVVAVGSDYYIYHADENTRGGVHRWKVSNLSSIAERSFSASLRTRESGLLAKYYLGSDLNNLAVKFSRIDQTPSFDWSSGIPAEVSLNASSGYSMSWQGFLIPLFSENTQFFLKSTGGVRLWVDGNLLIDQTNNSALSEFSGSSALKLGVLHSVRIEFSKTSSVSSLAFEWASGSLSRQPVPSQNLVPLAKFEAGNDQSLLAGLSPNQILQNNRYGWSRNPANESSAGIFTDWWSVKTSVLKNERFESPDLWMKFREVTGSYTVTRDLGSIAFAQNWSIASVISLAGNYPYNNNGGMYVEVLDAAGLVLARFYPSIDYTQAWTTTLYANNQVLARGLDADISAITNISQPLEINGSSAGIQFRYANFSPVTVSSLDSAANWRSPKTLRFNFFTNSGGSNLDRVIDLQSIRLKTNF